jgi:hypothetical protein
MVLAFDDPAPVPRDSASRYLVAWHGWYAEWIRPGWLTAPVAGSAFVPGPEAVATALVRWRARQTEFERQFYATRIPTR